MVNHLLPEVDVSGISREVLGKIQEEFSQRISDIMKSSEDISQITNKIQNISTLFVFILEFYKFAGNKVSFTLGELIQLANLFPYSFQKKQFEPFMRILNCSLDFQEKIKRLRELLALSVNLSMNEMARVITLCDDFWDRIEKVKVIQGLHNISSKELWWIFRGKGVSLYTLNLLIVKLQKYNTKGHYLQEISCIPDDFDKIIKQRKKLFKRLENILSQDDIHRICSSLNVETEYLGQLIEEFLEEGKIPITDEEREFLIEEFICCSNSRSFSTFHPAGWDDVPF